MLRFIEQRPAGGRASETAKPATVALGADHARIRAEGTLKQHLQQRGVSVADLGTNSQGAYRLSGLRAGGRPGRGAPARREFGMLICTTGVGMSIAANKVPGVRAALVVDEETAALARQHNDANVLCLGRETTSPEAAARIVDAFLSRTI